MVSRPTRAAVVQPAAAQEEDEHEEEGEDEAKEVETEAEAKGTEATGAGGAQLKASADWSGDEAKEARGLRISLSCMFNTLKTRLKFTTLASVGRGGSLLRVANGSFLCKMHGVEPNLRKYFVAFRGVSVAFSRALDRDHGVEDVLLLGCPCSL